MLAREFESGTFRFAWTQALERSRWTLAKVATLGAVVTAVTGAMSVLFSWYYQPYFPSVSQALYVSSEFSDRYRFRAFAPACSIWVSGYLPVGRWLAFRIGIFVLGVLIRRVVPAIVATLATYTGLAFAAGGFFRQQYLAPIITSKLIIPDSAWVIAQAGGYSP